MNDHTPPSRKSNRRQFLAQSLLATAGAGIASAALGQTPAAAKPAPASAPPAASPLTLPPLPFDAKALEPHISANTLSFHHGKHHKAYFEKTEALVKGTPYAGKSLEDIVKASAQNPADKKLYNNAAQAWNHSFYWNSLKPKGGGAPPAALKARIDKDFGSYEKFKDQFITLGVDHFSNGWVWLVEDAGTLKLVDSHDADSALVKSVKPLAVSDVWEHAYYLDYKNLRKDYLTAFVNHLLNWDFVQKNLG